MKNDKNDKNDSPNSDSKEFDHESTPGMKPENIDWVKLFNEYNKHHNSFREKMFSVEELDPVVWTWSETSNQPMISPKAMPEELSAWKKSQLQAQDVYQQLQRTEQIIKAKYNTTAGNMVTAETLMKFIPNNTTREALENALGISGDGSGYGEETFSISMAKRLLKINKGIVKSGAKGWIVDTLKKNLPFIRHDIGSEGEEDDDGNVTGKGFPLRWDAVGDYLMPVWISQSKMKEEDYAARDYAKRISGKEQTVKKFNGQKYYKVHMGFRPMAVEFYEREAKKHVATRKHQAEEPNASKYRKTLYAKAVALVDKVQARRMELAGLPGAKPGALSPEEKKSGAFELMQRYQPDAVQPGTKAAARLNAGEKEVDGAVRVADTKQLIPGEGQKNAVAYHRVNEGEARQTGRTKINAQYGGGIESLKNRDRREDHYSPEMIEGATHDRPEQSEANTGTFLAFGNSTKNGVQMNVGEGMLVQAIGNGYHGRGEKSRFIKIKTSLSGREDKYTPAEAVARLLNPAQPSVAVKEVFEGARKQLLRDVVQDGIVKIDGEEHELGQEEIDAIDKAAQKLCKQYGLDDIWQQDSRLQRLAKEFVVEQLWFSMRWEQYGTSRQRMVRFDEGRARGRTSKRGTGKDEFSETLRRNRHKASRQRGIY